MASDWRDDVIENIDSLVTINLYEILELDSNIKTDDVGLIKKQYKKLALKYHPDKGNEDGEKFELINLAYHILSDDELREKYNQVYEGYIDFETLKKQAVHTMKESNEQVKQNFGNLVEQLNRKHGYNVDEKWTAEEIMKRKMQVEAEREELSHQLHTKEKMSANDFKKYFETNRTVDNEEVKDLVAYEGTGVVSNCVFLDKFEDLYDNNGKLEDNFELPTLGHYKDDGMTLEQRMKVYQTQGELLADEVKKAK